MQRVSLQGYKPIAIQNQTSGSNKFIPQGVLDIITSKANLISNRSTTYVACNSKIAIGDKQHILVTVADANSSRVIAGANVSAATVISSKYTQFRAYEQFWRI